MGENRRKSSGAEESLGREKDENKNGFKRLRFEAVCAMKAVQKVGVEPTRMLSPQDFESSASAGSATSAHRQSVVEKKPRFMEAFVGSEGFEPPTSCL